jgi:zinc transport system ATP-binding protein
MVKERGMSEGAGKTEPQYQGVPSHPIIHPIEKNIALRFDRVSFSYEGVKVLKNASFHIHQGEFVALVGPNGSGKTTVLKLLLGLEIPQSGSIELFGAAGEDRRAGRPGLFSPLRDRIRDRLGYVPQQAQADRAFPITVEKVVRMGRLKPLSRKFRAGDKDAAAAAMERMEIRDLAGRLYNALSGGQRRRVLVARALASLAGGDGPGILVLDEPTANMDAESEERLFKTLGSLKGSTTILIVTHDRDFVSSLTDRVLCIDRGGGDGAIVQHPLEAGSAGGREGEDAFGGRSRVLHGESIPADSCYGGAAEEAE